MLRLLHVFLVLFYWKPAQSKLLPFSNSFVITSSNVAAKEELFLTNSSGRYSVFAVLKIGAEADEYYKNIFVLDDQGLLEGRSVFDIAFLPATVYGLNDLGRLFIDIPEGAAKGLRILNNNTDATPIDQFAVYLTKGNPCYVYGLTEGYFGNNAWGDCAGHLMLLSAEPAFTLYNFAIIDYTDFRVHTAPFDELSEDSTVYRTDSFTRAHSSFVNIASPVATLTTTKSTYDSSLRFMIGLNPKYQRTFLAGSSFTISSAGYATPSLSYGSIATPPQTEEYSFQSDRELDLEITVNGTVTDAALAITSGGHTKTYTNGAFNDVITARWSSVTIGINRATGAITNYAVHVTAR